MSKFKHFTAKLRAEGYGEKSARKIAAVEGAKKYGWKGMEEKAQAAKKEE